MRWPLVSRARLDDWQARCATAEARVETLLAELLRLKQSGLVSGAVLRPPATDVAHESDEASLLRLEREFRQRQADRRAERTREFVDRAVADLMAKGVSRPEAEREAKRLREEILTTTMDPLSSRGS